ncbi:MAG TPA: hypothetical protein VGF70_15325 [Solirubrobacteraceae bacterium]|jgi:hypothetical protein
MLIKQLRSVGLRGCAERRAIFVGLWPPMFWLIGDSVERSAG